MRVSIGCGFLLLCAAACTPDARLENRAALDRCAADAFQYLKWQRAGILEDVVLPNPHRIYDRNSAITMDFRPNRLNFVVGDTGRIEQIKCG